MWVFHFALFQMSYEKRANLISTDEELVKQEYYGATKPF